MFGVDLARWHDFECAHPNAFAANINSPCRSRNRAAHMRQIVRNGPRDQRFYARFI
jgi:hypothetical protein